jgi:hypothetical protein
MPLIMSPKRLDMTRRTPLCAYTNCVLEGLLQLLEVAHHKELSKVDRAYVLRWFLGEEADWNFKLRVNSVSRSKACHCGCTFVSNFAPFAAPTPSLCRKTMDAFFSKIPWLAFLPEGLKFDIETVRNSLVENKATQCFPDSWFNDHLDQPVRLCPLCQLGPSNTDHWLICCLVVGLALSQKQDKLWSLECVLPAPRAEAIQALQAIAAVRRYLLVLGEIGSVELSKSYLDLRDFWQARHSTESQCRIIYHRDQLLGFLNNLQSPGRLTGSHENLHGSCPRTHTAGISLHMPALLKCVPAGNKFKSVPRLLAARSLTNLDEFACFDPESILLTALLYPDVSEQQRNATLHTISCHCGKNHIVVTPVGMLCIGDQLRVEVPSALRTLGLPEIQSEHFDYLLFQTDGSFLRREELTAGGGGMILWGASVKKLPTALAFLSFQLPEASDSMHAEALGLKRAATYLSQHIGELCKQCASPLEVIFQMDNLPIIKHANREAKCTHLKAAEEVASAMSTVCPMVSHITFEYIPRESNSFADLA